VDEEVKLRSWKIQKKKEHGNQSTATLFFCLMHFNWFLQFCVVCQGPAMAAAP
jgi:hypothetical protein